MFRSEKIQFYLRLFKGLTLRDLVKLYRLTKTRQLAAGEIFVRAGAVSSNLWYINKGLVRGYHLKPSGDEVTILLRWEDQFIAAHDTVIMNRPSRFTYQAVEPTTLIEVDYAAAQKFFDENPRFAEARYYFVLRMLGDAMDRLESFVLLSPEERYVRLVKEKPSIVNRVPDKYLATLLGITPVSLSRIRKRIAEGHRH